MAKKPGPKPKIIDWQKVDNMCAIHCKGEEIAFIMEMDYDTLAKCCKRDHKMQFSDYIRQKSATGKMSLRRRQYSAAMEGNTTMLVWLGKNWLEQSDNHHLEIDAKLADPMQINFSVSDPKNEIKVTNAKT